MTYYGDHAPELAGAVISLATIAYIVFGLRIYTRIRNGSFGVDDWCMAAATVSSCSSLLDRPDVLMIQLPFTALTAACIGGAYHGIGIHQSKLNAVETKEGMQVGSTHVKLNVC